MNKKIIFSQDKKESITAIYVFNKAWWSRVEKVNKDIQKKINAMKYMIKMLNTFKEDNSETIKELKSNIKELKQLQRPFVDYNDINYFRS